LVAIATLVIATPRLGAYSGPLGISLGLVAGWLVVALGGGGRAATARRA
jgi:hypothetical protein